MAEQYSVEAILSAVDQSFSKTMNSAMQSMADMTNSANSASSKVGQSSSGIVGSVKSMASAFGLVQVAGKAFDVIKSSVGDAVKRIDTLNNSTRAFSNMGFATNQTKSAMNGLQKSIQGLPTALDDAVSGVQIMAASTQDLGKSQKVWSALNDAILGFGGSTADVNNATIQLSQAFANGKVDGQTWISMMNSGMGPALNAIAKQMKMTTGELQDGLSSGEISVEDFQDALINLDKNGGGGLKSLQKIAQDSTSGIGTSVQNAKTAVVRGVASMIEALNKFVQDVTGLSIAEMISAMGSKAEQALKGLGGVLQAITPTVRTAFEGITGAVNSAMPTLQKILDFAMKLAANKGFQSFAIGVLAFIAAFKGLSVVSGAITDVTSAISTLKTAGGNINTIFSGLQKIPVVGNAVAKAFSAINAVLSMNPWLLLAVAIAAVVAGLVYFFTQTETGRKMWSDFVSFLISAWNSIKETAGAVWNGIVQVVTTCVDAVKSAWNGIVEFFVNLWSGIVETASGIWNSFLAQMAPIIEGVQNVWNELVEFFTVLWNAIVQIAQTVWQGLVAFFSPIIEGIQTVWQGLVEFFTVLWTTIIEVTTTLWQGFVGFFSGIWNAIVTVVQTVWTVISTVISTYWQMIQTYIQTGMQILGTIFSAGWNALKTIVSTVWNAIKTVISTVLNVIAGIIKTVTAVIKGDWSGAWNAIKGIVSTVWNGIKSIISTVFNAIKNIITTIMDALKNIFKTGWETAKSIFQGGADAIKSILSKVNLFDIGKNIIQGLINGIQSMFGAIGNVVGQIGSKIKDGIGSFFQIHSPSRVMRNDIGKYIPEGLALGMLSQLGAVEDATKQLERAAMLSVSGTDLQDEFNKLTNVDIGTSLATSIDLQDSQLALQTNALLREIAGKSTTMILDDGTLVGKTAPQYNNTFGSQVELEERWG